MSVKSRVRIVSEMSRKFCAFLIRHVWQKSRQNRVRNTSDILWISDQTCLTKVVRFFYVRNASDKSDIRLWQDSDKNRVRIVSDECRTKIWRQIYVRQKYVFPSSARVGCFNNPQLCLPWEMYKNAKFYENTQ